MAKATAKVVQFSQSARADLQAALGASAGSVIPLLHELVFRGSRLHVSSLNLNNRGIREIADVMSAFRKALQRIDKVSPCTQLVLRARAGRLADLGKPDSNAWARVLDAREKMKESLWRLEWATHRPRRGRPRFVDRDDLALDVGLVLVLNGVQVGASRDGIFAKVLLVISCLSGCFSRPQDVAIRTRRR